MKSWGGGFGLLAPSPWPMCMLAEFSLGKKQVINSYVIKLMVQYL